MEISYTASKRNRRVHFSFLEYSLHKAAGLLLASLSLAGDGRGGVAHSQRARRLRLHRRRAWLRSSDNSIFGLGKWKVTDLQGHQVGTSEIAASRKVCAIREQWTSASGKGGRSINYYEAAEGKWHQDWVGGDGTILHLRGGLKEGAMVLGGESRGTKGTVINRITWMSLPGGKVKQEWASSANTGASIGRSPSSGFTRNSPEPGADDSGVLTRPDDCPRRANLVEPWSARLSLAPTRRWH